MGQITGVTIAAVRGATQEGDETSLPLAASGMICIIAPHEREPLAGAMRFVKATAVSAALKRLAMGFGLIALFSAILLISDLGHRNGASATSLKAGANGRTVKAAIVYFARDI